MRKDGQVLTSASSRKFEDRCPAADLHVDSQICKQAIGQILLGVCTGGFVKSFSGAFLLAVCRQAAG